MCQLLVNKCLRIQNDAPLTKKFTATAKMPEMWRIASFKVQRQNLIPMRSPMEVQETITLEASWSKLLQPMLPLKVQETLRIILKAHTGEDDVRSDDIVL